MGRIHQYVVSARFLLTTGHFIALLLALSTIGSNVEASFSDSASSSDISTAKTSATVGKPSVYIDVSNKCVYYRLL